MPRYAWEGRSRTGSLVRGDIEAASREAALAQVKASGVLVTRLGDGSDADPARSPASLQPELPSPPRPARRDGDSLRDKLFYIGVALVFTVLGLGTAYVAPVLTYDCSRDAAGSVSCSVHRRMYSLLPLATLEFPRVLSARIQTSTDRPGIGERRSAQAQSKLVLLCPSGPCWESTSSSWPMGLSNMELSTGIEGLLSADSPEQFHGWQAEKLPLLVATTFLLPAALLLFAVLLRVTVGRAWVEQRVADLEREASRRESERDSTPGGPAR
jgi:hypothetical protein